LNCVYIPYKLADVSVVSSLLATTGQNVSVNCSHLFVVQFLSKVAAQCLETRNAYRITSYTEVRERKAIS
jgi:hypothetical protein